MSHWKAAAVAIAGAAVVGSVVALQVPGPLGRPAKAETKSPDRVASENGNARVPELIDDGTGRPLRLTLFSPNDSIVAKSIDRYPELQRLTVRCDTLTRAGLRSLRRLKMLEDLTVHSKKRLNDGEIIALSQLTGLRRLRISVPELDDAAFRPLLALKGLEELGISSLSFRGSGLRDLVAAMPRLKHLDLSGTRISDDSLESLVHAVNLRELNLPQSVTDDGLVNLKGLRHLEALMIVHGTGVTDRGLHVIGQLTGLRHLDLTGTSVTDASLSSLSELKRLQTLKLRSTQIRGEGLRNLRHLDSLETIDLWGTELQPEHIKSFGEFPALRTLNVGWMTHLQADDACKAFGQLSQLDDLVIDVNRGALAQLRADLPQASVTTTDLTEWP